MKKITAKERLAKYPTGGKTPSGTIKSDSDSNDFYLRDLLTATLQYGPGWEKTPSGKALALNNRDLYTSVGLYNSNPNNLSMKPDERAIKYFDANSNNPNVQTAKDRIKTIGSGGISGNIFDTPSLDIANKGMATQESVASAVVPKMAMGGATDGLGGYGSLVSQAPQIADTIMSLFDNHSYSRQPIVNAASIHDMATPYSKMNNQFAMGGDTGLDDETMSQLQEMADSQGISIQELIQQLQSQQQQDSQQGDDGQEGTQDDNDGDEEGEDYAYGGIHIKKANRGKFNATKAKTGKTTEQLTHSTNPKTKKRAIFAQNASHWSHKHAMGGNSSDNIEVEGDEVLQAPGGRLSKVNGPSHEDGGVDVNVPSGTNIYSDRLKIDGKTMAERKLKRERAIARLEKTKLKNPTDKLMQNTLERSYENYSKEEQSDMQLQKAMNKIYNAKSEPEKFAFGGGIGDEDDNPGLETGYQINPYLDSPLFNNPSANVIAPDANNGSMYINPNSGNLQKNIAKPAMGSTMGTGDYVGLAGNAFNAIAPIINTLKNRAATPPVVNRFKTFGHNALDTNQSAQDITAKLRANQITDLNTQANTSRQRNRNSTSSVNTLRALDTVTDMGTSKAKQNINDSMSRNMLNVLSQRSQLQNMQDKEVMGGDERRDIEQKADTDNFYSNMGHNLTNFGTNVQGIGKSLNVSKSNKVDANMISQLSQYGLGFDEDGNLISTHK